MLLAATSRIRSTRPQMYGPVTIACMGVQTCFAFADEREGAPPAFERHPGCGLPRIEIDG